MARKRTGTLVRTKSGRLQGMVVLADGRRKRLPPFPVGTSEAMAREKLAAYAEKAGTLFSGRPAPQSSKKSLQRDCQDWISKWHADRVGRGLTSARVSLGHWTTYLVGTLGRRHPSDWTREDFRAVSRLLDEKVAAGACTWKTAQNVWATATKLAGDAANSKVLGIQCRNDNPADGVRGPDRGASKSKQYLYPSEFSKLVESDAVSVEWRRIFAVAVYTFTRAGELKALQWSDVDLDHNLIHVSRAIDPYSGTEKSTKSKAPRRVRIEPALLPLLVAMREEAGGVGPVLRWPTLRHHADVLRDSLQAAGVTRPGLFADEVSTKPIGFHDLRATGLTWLAVRGDDPLRIQQRAGHTSFATTQIYIREAEVVGDGFGEVFPSLPVSLLGTNRTTGVRLPDAQMTKGQCFSTGLSSLVVGAAGFEPATSSV